MERWANSMATMRRGGVNPEHKLWSTEEHALVGARGDREVAKATGRKLSAVALRRAQLRMRNPEPEFVPWSPEEDALLGVKSDAEVAHITGRSLVAVALRR